MTHLTSLFLDGNPLATLVLSETLAVTNLAATVASLRNQGVSVIIFPSNPADVSIPDPGLNAAIREALQKPDVPLTEQDLLGLTTLDARRRNVRSIEGLEVARNLVSLNLQTNPLTNFSLPNTLTNLTTLDLSVNSLIRCSFPGGLMKLDTLIPFARPLRAFGSAKLLSPFPKRLKSFALSGQFNRHIHDNSCNSRHSPATFVFFAFSCGEDFRVLRVVRS